MMISFMTTRSTKDHNHD